MQPPPAKSIAAQPLQTRRLTLRPVEPAHAEELAVALADPSLHGFIGGEPLGAGQLRARIERWAAGSPDPGQAWLNWVIQLDDGALVGTMQATVYDGQPDAAAGPTADVAWVVGVPWQGHGLAAEAAVALVAWLVSSGVRAVRASIHPDHTASQRVAAAADLAPTQEVVDGEVRWERLA